jgi:hypothetical protein
MRYSKSFFVVLLFACFGCGTKMWIGPYEFEQPSWWNEVDVVIPENINSEEEAREYIGRNFGADVGTEKTWKSALKSWAIFDQRTNRFPVYIAHCFMKGGEVEMAAKVYQDLYLLSHTQKEKVDWYKCYLAYNAGQAFEELDDSENAAKWYSFSAQVKFINLQDSASISYYANNSHLRFIVISNWVDSL